MIDFDDPIDELGQIEREVLACMLEYPGSNARVRSRLQASHFSRPTHARLFAAACLADDAGDAGDFKSVTLHLRAIDGFGPEDSIAVAALHGTARMEMQLERNVQTVLDAHRLRSFSSRAAALAKEARDASLLLSATAVQDFFNTTASDLTPFFAASASSKTNYGAEEMYRELDAIIRERRSASGKLVGIPTGFSGVDKYLGGLQRKSLYVVAAATGAGKTAFALNVVRNASHMAKAKSLLVSLEMDRVELWSRLLSAEARVGGMKIQTGIIDDADDVRLLTGLNGLRQLHVRSLEPPPTNIIALRAEVQAQVRNDGLDVLVVDYLQLMSGTAKDRGSREREVAEISRGLKLIAMEHSIAVIAVSQLNRSGDRNARPSLSMLRESGAIEQDANAVLFLWAEDDTGTEINWAIAKNRSGPIGDGRMRFERSTQRFYE